MIKRFICSLASCGLAFAALTFQPASATAGMITSFTGSTGGSALAGQLYANFDNRPLGSTTPTTANGLRVDFTGSGAFVQGNRPFQTSAPTLSGNNNLFFEPTTPAGPDGTTYVSTGVGSTTLTFAAGPSTYFGILWGTIDTFNSLTFNFVDGTTQTLTGSAVASAIGVAADGSATAYVNFLGTAFRSVVATSTQNSFEFDNVAFAVPEPSSLILCGIAGVAGLGFARARRRSAV